MKSVIKSMIRWSATICIAGSATIGSSTIGALQAFALPEQQVMQKLGPVLMYTIADNKGAPVLLSTQNQKNQPGVALIFVNRQDAQTFLDQRLKKQNPNLAKNVQVTPLSLAKVYQLAVANKNKPDFPKFDIIPAQQQVNAAMQLLRQSGQKVENFNGTPLFVARTKKEKTYLAIPQANQQVIPFFFNKEELQYNLDQLKKQKPDLASNLEIQVVQLEKVLQTLQTGQDKSLNQIVFVPPRESLELLRSLQPAAGNQPRPQPAKR